MAKYLKLFMVALFATMTFTLTSCGDDEPDNPNGNGKDYSFEFNNTPYYYGCDYLWAGIDGMDMTELLSHFSQDDDKEYTLITFTAQNTPFRMFDDKGEIITEQDATTLLKGTIFFEYFNPKSMNKGDKLRIHYTLRPDTEWDVYSYLDFETVKTSDTERYGLNKETGGSVKFVSYEENIDDMGTDYLTLEFDNLTYYLHGDGTLTDGSMYYPLDKSQKGVINGKIVFSSSY